MDIARYANPNTPSRCSACGGYLDLFSHISFRDYGSAEKMPDVMYFRCETCAQIKIMHAASHLEM